MTLGNLVSTSLCCLTNKIPFPALASLLVWCVPSVTALTLTDSFDNGLNSSIWHATSGQVRGASEIGFLSGNALWFGNNGFRHAETRDLNTLHGGSISFAMRTGDDNHPHWEESESGEYLALEYSINAGQRWRPIRYFAGWQASFQAWNNYSFDIPAAARSLKTRFRIRQTRHHGVGWDHWAIDNFSLSVVVVGTTWSQPLPDSAQILLGRPDASGAFHAVVKATGTFQLGSQGGGAGLYLATAQSDGSWSSLTSIEGNLPANHSTIEDMTVDSSGNVHLCGAFAATGLPNDAFVAKFDSSHVLQWFRIGHNLTASAAVFRGVGVDASGNVTVAGHFHNLMRFGANGNLGEPEINTGDADSSLIVRYNSNGGYQWARRVGGNAASDPDQIWGLAGNSDGSFYVHGRYDSSLAVAPLADLGTTDGAGAIGFIIKYDGSGMAQWMTHLGFSGEIRDMIARGTGLYAAGHFSEATFRPDGSALGITNLAGVYLVQLNSSSGAINWIRASSSVGEDLLFPGESIGLDSDGNPYFGHTFTGNASVAGQLVSADPDYNILLTRWDTSGNLAWKKRAGRGSLICLATDIIGQTYLAGQAQGLAAFESEAVEGNPTAYYLHKFNNVFEPTEPTGAFVLRTQIPANTPAGSSIGEILAKDSDGSGTQSFALVEGAGDEHNSFFTIGGTNQSELILSHAAVLVNGDSLSARLRVTDGMGNSAESIVPFTAGPPSVNLWARSFTADAATLRFCKVGPGNETYIGGFFSGNLTFGSWTVTSAGSLDAFLAKLDPAGSPEWIIRGGGTGLDRAWAVDVDSSGNVYLAGTVTGSFGFSRNGNSNFMSASGVVGGGGDDLYILALQSNGNVQWIRYLGGSGQEWPTGIRHDPVRGQTFVTGYVIGSANFGGHAGSGYGFHNGTITGPSHTTARFLRDGFVLAYNPSNGQQWVRLATGDEHVQGGAVAFDASGNVYVAGLLQGHASLDGVTRSSGDANTAFPTADLFLWKLSSGGVTDWVQKGGVSDQNEEVVGLGVDGSGRVTVAGRAFGSSFSGDQARFGTVSLPLMEGWDPILVTV